MVDWTASPQTVDGAVAAFTAALPGWWFSVGLCHVSADASCAPDSAGPDEDLLNDRLFENGFHAALLPPATMADALHEVMLQALKARAKVKGTLACPA